EGFERSQVVTAQVGGEQVSWQERLLLVRSLRLAQQQEAGLRERLGKAQAEVLALDFSQARQTALAHGGGAEPSCTADHRGLSGRGVDASPGQRNGQRTHGTQLCRT